MKDPKNEVLNKAADEDVIAGIVDGSALTDAALEKVNGGTFLACINGTIHETANE